MANAKIRINPARLPKPLLPPSMPRRIDIHREFNGVVYTEDEIEKRTAGLRLTRYERKNRGFGKTWTYQEEARLIKLWASGATIEEITEKMGRSYWSVKGRINKIRSSGRIVE